MTEVGSERFAKLLRLLDQLQTFGRAYEERRMPGMGYDMIWPGMIGQSRVDPFPGSSAMPKYDPEGSTVDGYSNVRDSIDKVLGLGGWALGKRRPRASQEDMGPIQMGADVGKAPPMKPPAATPMSQEPLDEGTIQRARQLWDRMDMHGKRPYMEQAMDPEGAFMAFARDFAKYGGAGR